MTIIDGVSTYTFPDFKNSGLDNYSREKRMVRYKSIDQLNTESIIGSDYTIDITFYQLTGSERDDINSIFLENSTTEISTIDEVLSGESYIKFSVTTTPIFIENKKIQFKKSIESKDIVYYNARLTYRADSLSTPTKP